MKSALIHSLQQQDDDKINIFETLESVMNDVKEKTRNEIMFSVISMLEDMDLSDEEIAQKIELTRSWQISL